MITQYHPPINNNNNNNVIIYHQPKDTILYLCLKTGITLIYIVNMILYTQIKADLLLTHETYEHVLVNKITILTTHVSLTS